MNNENFDKLEAWLSDIPEGDTFNMALWYKRHDCGTIMCMGGFCESMAKAERKTSLWHVSDSLNIVAEWLNISPIEAYSLFHPRFSTKKDWETIEPSTALKVVQHFRKTGLVNWKAVEGEVKELDDGSR